MATHTSSNAQKHLAILIDADNAPAAIVEGLFEEIAKHGVASVKRIYGDWTGPQLGGWKKVLLDHSIQPIQQFAYTKGKSLVSSDSDFTRLASRLREEGLTVYGFGEEKSPKPFVAACDKFIYIELLRGDNLVPASEEPLPDPSAHTSAVKPDATEQPKKPKAPVGFIAKI